MNTIQQLDSSTKKEAGHSDKSSFWSKVATKPSSLGTQFTGPSYSYAKWIKTPAQLGMGTNPNKLAQNVAGIMDYVTLLTEGGGPASKNEELPLGNRYFLDTGGHCKTSAGDVVKRSIYLNNVPDGTIPFLAEMDIKLSSFKGLVPGVLGDLDTLNPVHLFSAFTQSTTPPCSNIHMKIIDVNNNEGTAAGFVVDSEIEKITPCAFANGINLKTGESCSESFISANNKLRNRGNGRKNIKYNLKNKPVANVYTALVSGFLVYLIYKLVYKK